MFLDRGRRSQFTEKAYLAVLQAALATSKRKLLWAGIIFV